jgi:hypothetical protein
VNGRNSMARPFCVTPFGEKARVIGAVTSNFVALACWLEAECGVKSSHSHTRGRGHIGKSKFAGIVKMTRNRDIPADPQFLY